MKAPPSIGHDFICGNWLMVVLPHVLAGKNVFCGNAVKAVKGAFQYLNGLRKKFVGSAFSSMIFFTSARVSLNKNSVRLMVPYTLDNAGNGLPITFSNNIAGPPWSYILRWISAISKFGSTGDLIRISSLFFSRSATQDHIFLYPMAII